MKQVASARTEEEQDEEEEERRGGGGTVTRKGMKGDSDNTTTRKAASNNEAAAGMAIQRAKFRKLVEACKRKELCVIRQLLGEHPELLNYHDKFHRNLLHYVSILAPADEKRPMAAQPAPVRGDSLDYGSQQASSSECLDCFRYLASKCDPKLWFQVDQDGLTILHLAVISCNILLVREILFNRTSNYVFKRHQQRMELSSLVTALDKEHHSPLHWAVITNNLECVRLLIEHSGVQLVHQADLNGATPLHYATQTSDYPKYRQQLKQMLKNATSATAAAAHRSSSSPTSASISSSASSCCDGAPNDTTQGSEGARKQTERQTTTTETDSSDKLTTSGPSYNNLDILDFLAHLPGVNLECRDRDSRTALLWAASSGNRQAILLLLQSGANYLCQDANNLGPLHCAASHGFTDCLECLLLLSASSASTSSQINQPDSLNCTPLFYAVLSGNIDCVELLLDRGAKKDWQDVKGRTAAHFGALRGQLNTLKLLEAHGANLWLANKQGDLPLHYAIKSGRQQVVAWLLERSPYERPVNAINNIGRAPIHLAILKGNAPMVDFLIRRGANINQLVKVRDKLGAAPGADGTAPKLALVNPRPEIHHTKSGQSSYHYETALDMARRLNQRECLELLLRNSAKSAANVLASRQTPAGAQSQTAPQPMGGGNVCSLFDLQAADVASPIGFETSGSSAEPPVERPPVPLAASSTGGDRLPRLPARPKPMAEPVPQSSDSANSSALSVSSVTSLRGQKTMATRQHGDGRQSSTIPNNQDQHQANSGQQQQSVQQQADTGTPMRTRRPYRGGINYHNERINASIKCKLYENQTGHQHHHSFPPLNQKGPEARRHGGPSSTTGPGANKYHSAGSLPEQMSTIAGANTTSRSHSGGQQEIITNVNVYTTSPCAQCFHKLALLDEAEPQLHQKCQNCSGVLAADKRGASRAGVATKRSNVETRQATAAAASESTTMDGMISETSDSTDATSETIYDDSEQEELEDEAARGKFLPPLDSGMMMIEGNVAPTGPRVGGQAAMDAQQQQQQARYMASSRSYSQHLPVILSAEEDRSTSCETVVNQAPADQRTRQPQMNEHRVYEPSGSPLSAAGEEPRFDRSQRGRTPIRGHRVMADRYRSGGEPVRSPVAEYIHAPRAPTHNHLPQQQQQRSISEVRTGWIQHQHQQPIRANYSQIRAKVDSHRNDSGLSSHFGDELDGSSTAGRRSKSWSSTFSAPGNQQPAPDHQHLGGHHQFGGAKSPPSGEHRHLASHEHHHHHQQEEPHSRSCSRQTIIKTRRLSVDSEELASTIEKSIRRYKQESKLFEQLQNLKRSQIRSGRANEALLVKRLADHFRQEMLQESPVALEVYRGPYTYQAYELYLYDQLKRISQTNYARLAGARVPHKFTYQQQQQDHQYDDPTQQMMRETEKMHAAGGGGSDAVQEARDFLEEDLRAEQELQRVLNGGGGGGGSMQEDEVNFQESAPELLDTTIAIEPSGALEDIRVRQRQQDTGHEDHVTTIEHSEVRIDLDETEKGRAEELEASSKEAAAADNEQGLGGVVGELEELVAARLEKQARTSSTGSSHRSSVEIELEKLDKLPLRVDKSEEENKASLADDSIEDSGLLPAAALGSLAEEKERKQIESQAIDLTSAIITDALGNVSRAGSPILSRKRSQDDQSVVQRQTSSESVGTQVDQEDMVAQKSETKEEQEEEQEQEQEQATQGRGRRRSVVNIGDKIEIVYHKVGIEIDTVAEADDHSDDEREPTRGAAAAAVQEQRSADSEADVSDQQMREKTNNGQIEAIEDDRAGNESGDQKSEVSQREETGDELPGEIDHSVLQQHTDHEEEQEKAELGEDSGAREMEAPRRKSSSQQSPEMDSLRQQPSAAILRRASSPPAPKLGPNQKSNRYDTALPRRSSSPHHPTADAIITRKIFNGFDLDSLHEHRRLHQQRQLEEKNKADRAEHQGDSVRRVRQARRLQPIRKLTKPRSRLPEGPYRVYVPLELIRRRWNEVKQYERERCKALRLDDLSRSSVDNKTYEPTAGLQVEDRDAAPGISHAKSQPNLLRGTSREDKAERSVETASDTCSNFILIYELNKPSSSSTSSRADTNLTRRKQSSEQSGEQQQQQQRATAKHTNWCQKRVTKIVDVRTLKRTLSLPESLIYSNELLKRFSLLKL